MSMNENAKKQYLSLSSLKQRGWTESIIKNMSLTPDKEKVNPHYKCTSPMKLYDLGKIEALEKTEKFMLLFEKSQKRKKSATKAVETKMQKMKEYIHSIEIELPECEKEIVYSKAIEHYNEYHL